MSGFHNQGGFGQGGYGGGRNDVGRDGGRDNQRGDFQNAPRGGFENQRGGFDEDRRDYSRGGFSQTGPAYQQHENRNRGDYDDGYSRNRGGRQGSGQGSFSSNRGGFEQRGGGGGGNYGDRQRSPPQRDIPFGGDPGRQDRVGFGGGNQSYDRGQDRGGFDNRNQDRQPDSRHQERTFYNRNDGQGFRGDSDNNRGAGRDDHQASRGGFAPRGGSRGGFWNNRSDDSRPSFQNSDRQDRGEQRSEPFRGGEHGGDFRTDREGGNRDGFSNDRGRSDRGGFSNGRGDRDFQSGNRDNARPGFENNQDSFQKGPASFNEPKQGFGNERQTQGFGNQNQSQNGFGNQNSFTSRQQNSSANSRPGFGNHDDGQKNSGFENRNSSGFGNQSSGSFGNQNQRSNNNFGGNQRGQQGSFGDHSGFGQKTSFGGNDGKPGDDGPGAAFGRGGTEYPSGGGNGFNNRDGRNGGFPGRGGRDGGQGGGRGGKANQTSSFGNKNDDSEGGGNFESGGAFEFRRGGNGTFGEGAESDVPRAPRDWVPEERSEEELYKESEEKNVMFSAEDHDNVVVSGPMQDQRIRSWENSGLDDNMIDIIVRKNKWAKPFPIQAATVPAILQGFDVVAKAETGSGKTGAFAIPIVDWIIRNRSQEGRSIHPYAVVLEPTRELANQVYDEFRKITSGTGVKIVLNYGQINPNDVRRKIRGVDVYIGTLGRLMDFQQKGDVDLRRMKFLVFDEADDLLKPADMGHLEQIMSHKYFQEGKRNSQTLLFSATMDTSAELVAGRMMRGLATVAITNKGSRANRHIKQEYVQTLSQADKHDMLEKIFAKDAEKGKTVKTLIFVATKKMADMFSLAMPNGITAQSIHGDRSQDQRSKTILEFKRGEINVLVGTDVCARGLDIPKLDRVIVYDTPNKNRDDMNKMLNDVAHRIGRTGRAQEGHAIIFCDNSVDKNMAEHLIQFISEAQQEVPEFLKEIAEGRGGGSGFGSQSAGFGAGSSGFGFGSGSGSGFGAGKSDEKKEEPSAGGFGSSGFGSSGFGSSGFGAGKEEDKKKESSSGPSFGTSGFGNSFSFGARGFGSSGFGDKTDNDLEKSEATTSTGFGASGFGSSSGFEKADSDENKKETVEETYSTHVHTDPEETEKGAPAEGKGNSEVEEADEFKKDELEKKEEPGFGTGFKDDHEDMTTECDY